MKKESKGVPKGRAERYWMMPRIRPGSEIDAAMTILLAFFAYAILLFAVMVWRES